MEGRERQRTRLLRDVQGLVELVQRNQRGPVRWQAVQGGLERCPCLGNAVGPRSERANDLPVGTLSELGKHPGEQQRRLAAAGQPHQQHHALLAPLHDEFHQVHEPPGLLPAAEEHPGVELLQG